MSDVPDYVFEPSEYGEMRYADALEKLREQHETLKAKVREIVRIADCRDDECSQEDYLKLWEDLREMAE